jgi:plastocyanin
MRRLTIPALTFAALLAFAACGGAATPSPSQPAASAPAASAPGASAPAASSPATSVPAASASSAGSSAATAGGSVEIKDFAFNPATITAKVGDEITWTNNDTAPHTVTLDDGSVDSGNIAQSATYKHAFMTAGTFTYHCSIHTNMKGTITVS